MEDNIVNWVENITDGSGEGSGFGDGYGFGYGNGILFECGNGYGREWGDGHGYGSGYGNGDGRGKGHGYGYGRGYGHVNGSGDGYGDRLGDGISEFNGYKVYDIDGIPTIIYNLNIRSGVAHGAIIRMDMTLKPCFIAKRGDCFAHGEDIHEAVRNAEAKYQENRPLKGRIEDFLKEFSTYDRIPAKELFRWHNVLTGSCEMGRKQFCEEHGIDLETDSFTIPEFIELTKDSYGSEAIRELEKKKLLPMCNLCTALRRYLYEIIKLLYHGR